MQESLNLFAATVLVLSLISIPLIVTLLLKTNKKIKLGICITIVIVISFMQNPETTNLYNLKQSRVRFEKTGDLLVNKKSAVLSNVTHKKWIIVTTIFFPTQQLTTLSQIPGWALLVVADQKTPQNWLLDNTIFLDIETQQTLGYSVLKHLPWNSYTLKVIGYLFAIQHGAEIIYDTDDYYAPEKAGDFERNFVFDVITHGLVVKSNRNYTYVKNPYEHFGKSNIWPRGYPLELIGAEYRKNYTVCRARTPLIQQGLVNGDPDVDAIYRLTNKKLYKNLDIKFDPSAPPIIYPPGILAPFNSQNTLFHYDAFWALLLPISVSSRVTDIWRGYLAQPILWKLGRNLGFLPAHSYQVRNVHNYLKDFTQERRLYEEAGNLTKFLVQWKCDSIELFECMSNLWTKIISHKFLGQQDFDLLQAWISDLKSIGYKAPELNPSSEELLPCVDKFKSNAIFNPVNVMDKNTSCTEERYELRKFCNFTITAKPNHIKVYPTTLLVITFNFQHYDNIWLLELIYRPHFPNMLYCGDGNSLKETNFANGTGLGALSFVHANVTTGLFWYECALRTIDMNYGVENYIFLSDDVIYKFWETEEFDKDEVWGYPFQKYVLNVDFLHQMDLTPQHFAYNWDYGRLGRVCPSKALKRITLESKTNEIMAQFVQNRRSYGLSDSLIKVGFSDFFQVPKSKEVMFYDAGKIVRESEVLLEFGVPLITTGISSLKEYVAIKGIWIWNEERNNPIHYFKKIEGGIIFHPLKMSNLLTNLTLKRFVIRCNNVV